MLDGSFKGRCLSNRWNEIIFTIIQWHVPAQLRQLHVLELVEKVLNGTLRR
jgi:hypothetical protein